MVRHDVDDRMTWLVVSRNEKFFVKTFYSFFGLRGSKAFLNRIVWNSYVGPDESWAFGMESNSGNDPNNRPFEKNGVIFSK